MSTPAVIPTLTSQQMSAVIAEPMLACPEVLRPALWQVWVCHQHLFPSVLPLAGSLGRWVREGGLDLNDAQKILRETLSPERMMHFRFAADLLTYLATAVQEAINSRRILREMERRNGTPTPRAEVDRLLAGVGTMPND